MQQRQLGSRQLIGAATTFRLSVAVALTLLLSSCGSHPTIPLTEAAEPAHFSPGDLLTVASLRIVVVHPSASTSEVLFSDVLLNLSSATTRTPRVVADGSVLVTDYAQGWNGPLASGTPSVIRLGRGNGTTVRDTVISLDDVWAVDAGAVSTVDDSLFLWGFRFSPDGSSVVEALLLCNAFTHAAMIVDVSDSLSFESTLVAPDGSLYLLTLNGRQIASLSRYDLATGGVSSVSRSKSMQFGAPLAIGTNGLIYCGARLGNTAPFTGAIATIDPIDGRQEIFLSDSTLGYPNGIVLTDDSTAFLCTGASPGYMSGTAGISRLNIAKRTTARVLPLTDPGGIALADRNGPSIAQPVAHKMLRRGEGHSGAHSLAGRLLRRALARSKAHRLGRSLEL